LLLGILKETAPAETRVALLPESLKSLLAQGISVTVESGAGLNAGASDQAYIETGATITTDRTSLLASADVLPLVNAPDAADQAGLKPGAVVIGFLKPLDSPHALTAAIARPATLFSMELVPRISRAQSMDALFIDGHCCRLQGRHHRRRPPAAPLSHAYDRRWNHPAGPRLCHRRRRRRPAGHRHGPPPGRCR